MGRDSIVITDNSYALTAPLRIGFICRRPSRIEKAEAVTLCARDGALLRCGSRPAARCPRIVVPERRFWSGRFPNLTKSTTSAEPADAHDACRRTMLLDLSPDEWTAVWLSLRIALWATAVSLPFGIAVAFLLARASFWGKTLVDGIVHLPLVLPPVVTGYMLLILFGRRGPIGAFLADHFGIVFSFRWTGAALAAGVMSFPLLVRAVRLAIEAIDRRFEEAASTLGANRSFVLLTVTLPLALPGIIAGSVLAFARALGEFGATITFVSNIPGETQTISAAIYTYTQVPGGDAAALRLVVIAVAIALVALIVSEWFARRAGVRFHGG
jgi:molybdate transport system permease protein